MNALKLCILLALLQSGCLQRAEEDPVPQVANGPPPPIRPAEREPQLRAGLPRDAEEIGGAKSAIIYLIACGWVLPILLIVLLRAYFYSPPLTRTRTEKKLPVKPKTAANQPSKGKPGERLKKPPRKPPAPPKPPVTEDPDDWDHA